MWGHKEADRPRARWHYMSILPYCISPGISSFLIEHSSFSQTCWRYRRPALQKQILAVRKGSCKGLNTDVLHLRMLHIQPWGVWCNWSHSLWKQNLISAGAFLHKDLGFRIDWIPLKEKDPLSITPWNINQVISSSRQTASVWAFPLFYWRNSGSGTK